MGRVEKNKNMRQGECEYMEESVEWEEQYITNEAEGNNHDLSFL